jgi:hypothetical protein
MQAQLKRRHARHAQSRADRCEMVMSCFVHCSQASRGLMQAGVGTCMGDASAQGSCPVASSHSTTPKDHTSDFSLYDCERSTSGAHHCNAGRTSTVSTV